MFSAQHTEITWQELFHGNFSAFQSLIQTFNVTTKQSNRERASAPQ
jgi:hypothetical protein